MKLMHFTLEHPCVLRVAGFSCRATQTHRRTEDVTTSSTCETSSWGTWSYLSSSAGFQFAFAFSIANSSFFFLMLFCFGVEIFPPFHCEFEKINLFLLS